MSLSPATAVSTPATSLWRSSYFALLVLSLINLVNYLDRYVIASALPAIQRDFGIDDAQAGLLGTLFMVVFMLSSPVVGFLGDRVPRRLLVAAGVLLWSLATGASGLATSFGALLVARSCIGIGEAGYGAVAPSIISDLFPRDQRTRMLSFFYIAIPVGAAAGYGLGGWMTAHYSWNAAFYAAAVPGLVLGTLALFMHEPVRGAMDEPGEQKKLPFLVGLKGLARNSAFWATTTGYTLMTFSIGGLSFWMPTFLERERGLPKAEVGLIFGAVTAVAGLAGTLVGGIVGDKLERRSAGGALRLSGVGLLLAAPLMYVAANLQGQWLVFGTIFAAQFFIFINSGPINAAIVNCVTPAFRAFAMGINVLCIHMLGDAISPYLIGWLSKHSNLELAIEVNSLPVLLGGVALLVAGRLMGRGQAAGGVGGG